MPDKDPPNELPAIESKAVGRITITDAYIYIGDERLSRGLLQTWRGWDEVLRVAKKLDPPFSTAELELLRHNTTTVAGRNGYAECAAALRGMGKL